MGTVYITQEDAFIGKTDERLQVRAQKTTVLEVPLIKVEGVVVLGRATVSPAALSDLLERQIPLSFLTQNGRYLGRLEPELNKNIFVRAAQWRAGMDPVKTLPVVKAFVRGKLKNYRQALLRDGREDPTLNVGSALTRLSEAIAAVEPAASVDQVRGLEGSGSAAYFGVFGSLIRAEGFTFQTRQRRPPPDPVNALLSLGYALLRHDVQSAINIVGFDPYLGFLHTQRYGRPSLALDLMEEFRPLVVDAVVLSAINKRVIKPEDFVTESLSGAVSLTPEGLRTFLRGYEQKKQSKFKHPVLQKQCTYQEAFELQARLLGKFLMGETGQYPPLVLR